MISVQVFDVEDKAADKVLLQTELAEIPFPGDELMCRLGSLRVVRRTYLLYEDDAFAAVLLWVRVEKAMEP